MKEIKQKEKIIKNSLINDLLRQNPLKPSDCYKQNTPYSNKPPMLNTDFRDNNMETQQEYFGK